KSTRRTWLGLDFVAIVVWVVGTTGTVQAWVPALASPGVSAAGFPRLGAEIVVSELDNEQYLPAVAYNWKHNEYLVVWHNQWGGGGRDIYAQRVTSTGELKSWFAVSAGPNSRTEPSVAYDPVHDRYLVVWMWDSYGDGSDWDIRGRFIPWNGPSGSLGEFNICDWPTHQSEPKAVYARAQEEFLVVWDNHYEFAVLPAYVSGQRIMAADGSFPDGAWTIANHATEDRWRANVAYNLARNEYLVVYDDGFDIYGTRLTGSGVKLGGGEFSIAGWPDREIRPAVAACRGADQYAVVWQSFRFGDYDLYVRFIRGDGTPESVHPISELAGDQGFADVACDELGQKYLVTWQETLAQTGISGRIISPNKTMEPGFQIVAPGPGRADPAVGGGESNYLVVWEHHRGGTAFRDIHGRLITPYTVFLPLVPR
ncbi:MAG TPA: hypothetical protein VMY98_07390, partial [Anaerolineae bacterium]|nr:hypothetical protein [Anaerolineae bacterium]